jgi:hypothetical protein
VLAIFASLALLGILTIDPIGIAAMPILLIQKKPITRSLSFLAGSFMSITIMGILLARYIGRALLNLEITHSWLMPSIEFIAGLIMLGIALFIFTKRNHTNFKASALSETVITKLQRGNLHLFILGFVIILVQSLVDVVFVVAMIRLSQLHITNLNLSIAAAIYASSSLLIQFLIVAAFVITPLKHRDKTLVKVRTLLDNYINHFIIGISLVLGFVLLIVSVLKV